MKKLILLLLFIPLVSFGQDTIPATKILTQKEAYMNKMYELKKDYNTKDRYVIYPTENIYTSLLLDTQTGKIEQLQISLGDTPTDRVSLSDRYIMYDELEAERQYKSDLKRWEEMPDEEKSEWDVKPDYKIYKESIGKVGQFKLYPTKNMFNFLMVDTINGFTWQVQWSTEEEKRMVIMLF